MNYRLPRVSILVLTKNGCEALNVRPKLRPLQDRGLRSSKKALPLIREAIFLDNRAMTIVQFDSSDLDTADHIRNSVEKVKACLSEQPIVLVSSMGSSEKKLLDAAHKAAEQDIVLSSTIAEGLRTFHIQIAQQLITGDSWKQTRSTLSNLFEELSTLLQGFYLAGELTPRGESVTRSYGERASATIMARLLEQENILVAELNERILPGDTSEMQEQLQSSLNNWQEQHKVLVLPLYLEAAL